MVLPIHFKGKWKLSNDILYFSKDKIQNYLITAWKYLSKFTIQNFQYCILACDLYVCSSMDIAVT